MLWLAIACLACVFLVFGLMGYIAGNSRIPDVEWGVNITITLFIVMGVAATAFSLYAPMIALGPWLVGATIGRVVRACNTSS